MDEIWKSCTNTLYEVSNLGNVRRTGCENNRKKITLKNGYDTVMFSTEGHVECMYVHRLVAEAFLDNPCNYSEINHINHIRTDNRVSNLEWCNRLYNVQDCIGTTMHVYNVDGSYLGKYDSIRECERVFGIGHSSLRRNHINSGKPIKELLFYTYPIR